MSDTAIETLKVNNLVVKLYYDEDPLNPRKEYDNIATFVCWHRSYNLGDRKPNRTEEDALQRGGYRLLQRYLRRFHGILHFEKLCLYDHSGITMYLGGGPAKEDSAGWDSGPVGFAYVTREDMEKAGFTGTEATAQKAEEIIEAEVNDYDKYLRGEIYGFCIRKPHEDCEYSNCPHDETVESIWGFDDLDETRKTALEYAKGYGINE